MDKFPVLWEGKSIGEMTACWEREETAFRLQCDLPGEGLWNLWAVGTQGALRLGLPQTQGNKGRLEKKFSRRMTDPLGALLYGELRNPGKPVHTDRWRSIREGHPIRTAWLSRQLRNRPGVLWSEAGTGRLIAVPYEPEEPCPVMPMFCFTRMQTISGRPYLVLQISAEEQPLF